MSETGWEVVGRLVKARRDRLHMHQGDLRDHGGPGVATVSKVERAAQPSFPLRTQQQLETSLGWPAGTIAEVVDAVDVKGDWDQIGPGWEVDLLEAPGADVAPANTGAGEPVRRAGQLSDAELLAELTFRFTQYATRTESTDGRPANAQAVVAGSPRDVVVAELVRRRKNPGWLMDAAGLEPDELAGFLADDGPAPSKRTLARVEKALGWAPDSLRVSTKPAAPDQVAAAWRAQAG